MDTLTPKDVTAALELIRREVMRQRAKEYPLSGAHDGYAHLLEAVDGLWAEVKATPRNWTRLREEATQIAAVAARFIIDITNVDDDALIQAKRDAGLL